MLSEENHNIQIVLVVETLKLRQNVHHFADYIFKCIFFNENIWILITILQKFVAKDPIDNMPSVVWVIAWCWTGNKPISKPVMAQFNNTYMCYPA